MAFTPLQRRDVRLLSVLRGVTFFGDSMALITLYLRLAPVGHAWAIAALSIAGTLPLVVLSPLAGLVIDRVPAKRLLTQLGLAEAAICVAIGYWHGMTATLALMLALNSCVAFSYPGYSALVPTVAGGDNISRAQGLMQAVQGVAAVLGPITGGLLVGWTGQSWPLYLDALCYVLAAFATTALHHDRRPSPATTIERLESEKMMAGVMLLWNDRLLRPVVLTTLVFLFALNMVNVGEVFFVTVTLHASAIYYGLLGASFGLGSIAGSLLAGRLRQGLVQLARAVLATIVVVGAMIGGVGLVTRVGYIYPLMLVAGVAAGVAQVAFMTLCTVRSPELLRGRVFAAIGALFTGNQIGATALGGLVLTLIAPRTVFQIGGIAATVSALALGPFALRSSAAAHAREQLDQGE
jgi:MFS family permease